MYILKRKIVVGGFLLVASNSVLANDVAREVKRDLISFSALDQLLAQDPPPTRAPTRSPVDNNGEDGTRTPPPTPAPTGMPTTTPPTVTPTGSDAPSISNAPTSAPSKQPSSEPSGAPSGTPSGLPSISPSNDPSTVPSTSPTAAPSKVPSRAPSSSPSPKPSNLPSISSNPSVLGPTTSPSRAPTGKPSSTPSSAPSSTPSTAPSDMPSTVPSPEPSTNPSSSPSKLPSSSPTSSPSSRPTNKPTSTPSQKPSMVPSNAPTTSRKPTGTPTVAPSRFPSRQPSKIPTNAPSGAPSPPPTRRPTRTPTFSPTSCPNPEVCLRFQTQGDTGFFAIEKCAASCDFDIQCKEGLACYKRSRGQKNVPGCVGDADQIGTGDHNFCVQPPSNQLVLLGVNQSPSSAYPLRQCAGDCDNDNDCAGGLFCFERNGLEAVPGCIGTGQNQFDYCYNPGSGFERLAFFGDQDYDYYELGQCEGDCDFDSDCEIGLVCYEREGGDNGRVPTCVGNANTIGFGNDDFCIPRPRSNTLISVFENQVGGDAAGGGIFPIPRCAGDCDSDIDCLPGLTCFQRAGFSAVPGCSGTGEEDFDYCI